MRPRIKSINDDGTQVKVSLKTYGQPEFLVVHGPNAEANARSLIENAELVTTLPDIIRPAIAATASLRREAGSDAVAAHVQVIETALAALQGERAYADGAIFDAWLIKQIPGILHDALVGLRPNASQTEVDAARETIEKTLASIRAHSRDPQAPQSINKPIRP